MAGRPHDQARHETPLERADRNFARVAAGAARHPTGAQTFFAFLPEQTVAPRVPTPDTVGTPRLSTARAPAFGTIGPGSDRTQEKTAER